MNQLTSHPKAVDPPILLGHVVQANMDARIAVRSKIGHHLVQASDERQRKRPWRKSCLADGLIVLVLQRMVNVSTEPSSRAAASEQLEFLRQGFRSNVGERLVNRVAHSSCFPQGICFRMRKSIYKCSSRRRSRLTCFCAAGKAKAGPPSYTPTHTHTGLITAATSPLPASGGGSPELIPLLVL
jgi:hypothetical protein